MRFQTRVALASVSSSSRAARKVWALRFRRPDGRTGKLTLGPFDPMSEMEGEPVIGGPLTLAAARRLAADIMRQRALGKDVIADHTTAKRRRRADYEQRAAQNFAVAARRFIEEYAKPQLRSWETSARLLGFKPSTLEPVKDGLAERWRDKLVSEITPDDVHDLVDEIRTKGTPGLRVRTAMSDSAARVALLRLSKFFSWAVQQRLATANPCPGLATAVRPCARARAVRAEIKWLWRAAGDLGEPFGPALRLLLLTGQRRGEVGGMRWDELSEDRSTWTLPAAAHQEWARPCRPIVAPSAGTHRQRPCRSAATSSLRLMARPMPLDGAGSNAALMHGWLSWRGRRRLVCRRG